MSYKIGDTVLIESSNIDHIFPNEFIGEIGVIVDIDHEYEFPYAVHTPKYNNGDDRLWCKVKALNHDKIVITHDGKTTTATKYCGDGTKVSATAKCSPEDDFVFEVGAKLALERLTNKAVVHEEPPKAREVKVGDIVRYISHDYFGFYGNKCVVDVVSSNNLCYLHPIEGKRAEEYIRNIAIRGVIVNDTSLAAYRHDYEFI